MVPPRWGGASPWGPLVFGARAPGGLMSLFPGLFSRSRSRRVGRCGWVLALGLAAGFGAWSPTASGIQVASLKSGLWCGESRRPTLRVMDDRAQWRFFLASRGNPPAMANLLEVFEVSFDYHRLLVIEMGRQETTQHSLRFYGGVLRQGGQRLALRVKWTKRSGNRWQEPRPSNPCLVVRAAKGEYREIRVADHHGESFLLCRQGGAGGDWRCRPR